MSKILVHIHRPGERTRVIDLAPPSLKEQYRQLVAALQAILARQGTQDEAPVGHPFYGNQYTDVVLGPKPTEAKSKGVKNVVHELLTSGHPFTFEELKKATGAKLDQQLHNAINELKAGKHASGALSIVKLGKGQYQVMKPNGEPAKALPKEEPSSTQSLVTEFAKEQLGMGGGGAELPDLLTAEEKAQGAPKAADPSNPPTPTPKSEPSPVSAPPGPTPAGVAKAPATKMTVDEADEAYAKAMNDLHLVAGEMASMPTPANANALAAKHWKEGKAQLMAQWKANTTGVDQKPLPVEVFPEDEALAYELAKASFAKKELQAEMIAQAMSDWKEDTHAAKMKKNTPPPAVAPAAAAQPMFKLPPHMKHLEVLPEPSAVKHDLSAGLSFPVPKTTVPDDHKGIHADDFVNGSYSSGIAKLHKDLHASAADAISNKKQVQHGLETRLAASPHFQSMQEQFKKKNGGSYGGSLAASIISTWAGSSGDHNPAAVSAQLAIRDVFGMHPDSVETKAFGGLAAGSASEDSTHKQAAQKYGIDVSTPAKLESYKKGMQDFALAQYHETQSHLAKLGIKELHLVRGMKFGASSATAEHVNLKLQPASSFSTAHNTAHGFAGGHSLFVVKVPASQVLGSFCTGYGCTNESEVVVLNHGNLKAIKVGTSNANNKENMVAHIKHKLGGTGPGLKAHTEMSVEEKVTNHPYYNEEDVDDKLDSGKSYATILQQLEEYHKDNKGDVYYKTTAAPVAPAPTASHELPPIPLAGNKTLMNQALTHAKTGGLTAVLAFQKSIATKKLPKTKKYVASLVAHLQAQHKTTMVKAAKPTPTMTGPLPPPVKNAHYYKKLKAKVTAHPFYNTNTFEAIKQGANLSNEKMLALFEKQYETQYGKTYYG